MTKVRSSYFNTFLFLPIAGLRVLSQVFGFGINTRESDFDINNPFLNKLFFSIFNAERNLLSHITFPFGISIFVVMKKNTPLRHIRKYIKPVDKVTRKGN